MQKQLQEHFGELVRCTTRGYSFMHDYGNSEVPRLYASEPNALIPLTWISAGLSDEPIQLACNVLSTSKDDRNKKNLKC